MKNILKLTLILAGVLMISSCDEDPSMDKVGQSVVNSASFIATDYYVINTPRSLGVIYLSNTQSWKVGDKIKVTGSLKFKTPEDSGYITNEYASSCEIEYVTDNAVFVGYDYSGINYKGSNTTPIHIEFNEGLIESVQLQPKNGG